MNCFRRGDEESTIWNFPKVDRTGHMMIYLDTAIKMLGQLKFFNVPAPITPNPESYEDAMFFTACPSCGEKISNKDKKCSKCGSEFDGFLSGAPDRLFLDKVENG